MDKNNISYYVIAFLNIFNEKAIDQLLALDQVKYLSIIYKQNYPYQLSTLIKYLEPKQTPYGWKVHSIVREDIEDGEIIDSILDINYTQSGTNHLIITKRPNMLSNEFIHSASEYIINSQYSSDLFGAVTSTEPYNLFCTAMSIYLSNDKNRNEDILSKIKSLDRKIYEV